MRSQSDIFQNAQSFNVQRPATWRDVMSTRTDTLLHNSESSNVASYASEEQLARRNQRMAAAVPYLPPPPTAPIQASKIGSRIAVPDDEGYYAKEDSDDDSHAPIRSLGSAQQHGDPRWAQKTNLRDLADGGVPARGGSTTSAINRAAAPVARGQRYHPPGVVTPKAPDSRASAEDAAYVAREIVPPLRPPSSLREIPRY